MFDEPQLQISNQHDCSSSVSPAESKNEQSTPPTNPTTQSDLYLYLTRTTTQTSILSLSADAKPPPYSPKSSKSAPSSRLPTYTPIDAHPQPEPEPEPTVTPAPAPAATTSASTPTQKRWYRRLPRPHGSNRSSQRSIMQNGPPGVGVPWLRAEDAVFSGILYAIGWVCPSSGKEAYDLKRGKTPKGRPIPIDHPVHDMPASEQASLRQRGFDPVIVAEVKMQGGRRRKRSSVGDSA